MSTLVDSPVASESLAKVGVKTFFVAACPAAAKCDWVEDGSGICGHTLKVATTHTSMHGGERRVIVAGLQGNITKTVGGEVSAKDE
jgi:hypothetical protein